MVIHAIVQTHYKLAVASANDIAAELPVPPYIGSYASAYLDIADFTTNEFYEIKPLRRAAGLRLKDMNEVQEDYKKLIVCSDIRLRNLQPGRSYGRYVVSTWPVIIGAGYDPRRDGTYVVVTQRTAPGLISYSGEPSRRYRNRRIPDYQPQEVENFVRQEYPKERQDDWGDHIGWGNGRILLPASGVEQMPLASTSGNHTVPEIPPLPPILPVPGLRPGGGGRTQYVR